MSGVSTALILCFYSSATMPPEAVHPSRLPEAPPRCWRRATAQQLMPGPLCPETRTRSRAAGSSGSLIACPPSPASPQLPPPSSPALPGANWALLHAPGAWGGGRGGARGGQVRSPRQQVMCGLRSQASSLLSVNRGQGGRSAPQQPV